MSTLYIHLPCKASADHASQWLDIACPYAWMNDKNAIEREAVSSIANLSATIAKAQRLIVLLAASDVTLLQVAMPPMSAAKLKAALPNLVEDEILGNLADCIVVAGDVLNGSRTVAVVQRAWLEQISQTFTGLGARHVSILPAQLCLPQQASSVVAVITRQDNNTDVTLRLSGQTGIGLALAARTPDEVLRSVAAVVSDAPVLLHLPQEDIKDYQAALHSTGLAQRISLAANAWPMWIAGARNTPLNLMAGLSPESSFKVDWQPWRWPLILAAGVLLVNIAALNFDWWQMSREAKNLRATMTQIYQSRFPKETVIIDPIAQMRQKISFAKRDAGLAAPDDFVSLAANFATVWNSATDKPVLASLEYREHALLVSFKTNANETLTQQMQAALAQRNLSLTTTSPASGATIWQIRSIQ